MSKSVLILEDDLQLAKSLKKDFEEHGYFAEIANQISEIQNVKYNFAVIDLRLHGEFGLNAIEIILGFNPECSIVVLSGYGSVASAVEAIKKGALDFIAKPASFSEIESALLGKRSQPEVELKRPSLSQVEHEYIDFLLTRNAGNISKTAKELGLHRQSLQRKLKKYT